MSEMWKNEKCFQVVAFIRNLGRLDLFDFVYDIFISSMDTVAELNGIDYNLEYEEITLKRNGKRLGLTLCYDEYDTDIFVSEVSVILNIADCNCVNFR